MTNFTNAIAIFLTLGFVLDSPLHSVAADWVTASSVVACQGADSSRIPLAAIGFRGVPQDLAASTHMCSSSPQPADRKVLMFEADDQELFRCDVTGESIQLFRKGDAVCDCRDGSDEPLGDCFVCCDLSRSISPNQVHDGLKDCLDASDELLHSLSCEQLAATAFLLSTK
eukprot:c5182_g1_i2.p1 GENE.c5182_g1_i2~~c5182_g1_i2.p1  ORF type:complete len:184 (-),score=40.67 c5182_g1_i2:31-540(-)